MDCSCFTNKAEGPDANSVVVVVVVVDDDVFVVFVVLVLHQHSNKNQHPTMEPVTEMLIWVLVPAFFIASATFLVYVYACEEPELKEE